MCSSFRRQLCCVLCFVSHVCIVAGEMKCQIPTNRIFFFLLSALRRVARQRTERRKQWLCCAQQTIVESTKMQFYLTHNLNAKVDCTWSIFTAHDKYFSFVYSDAWCLARNVFRPINRNEMSLFHRHSSFSGFKAHSMILLAPPIVR